jgi:antitoxin HicB
MVGFAGRDIQIGKGGHLKVTLNGKRSVLPMSSGEIKKGTMEGEDEGEALLQAVDALETAMSFYIDAGRDLPKAGKGRRTVRPSALGCIKLAIYQTMRDQGVKKSDLARRMGWHMPQCSLAVEIFAPATQRRSG